MTNEGSRNADKVVGHIAVCTDFTQVLQFALITRRGTMLKPWQERVAELTEQNIVDLIEVAAIVLDQLHEKEIEVGMLSEVYEMAKESLDSMTTTATALAGKLTETSKSIADQRDWSANTIERLRKENQS